MNNILILFGHPAFKRSTINAALREAVETLISVVAISMFLAPLLFMVHDRLIAPRLQKAEAELLIITLGDHEKSMELVKLVQKHYPQLKIAVNAVDRRAAFELMDLGVTTIRRETFGTALTLGQDALQLLGFDPYETYKIRRLFRKKDKETMPELYRIHRQDEDKYISLYQQHNANLAELMTKDREVDMAELDKAWTVANPET